MPLLQEAIQITYFETLQKLIHEKNYIILTNILRMEKLGMSWEFFRTYLKSDYDELVKTYKLRKDTHKSILDRLK